ncbi:MAG: hypothetical protein LJE97_04850 [Betaproteobacteria bacterium]|jgi:hypothetical protein|nr:hypothetical protein [Betaproteobacteria bacterium]
MDQTDSKPTNPVVLGVAAAVIIVSLVAIGALSGILPLAKSTKTQESLEPAANPVEAAVKAARPTSTPEPAAATQLCATCGTVESVRAFEVRGAGTGGAQTVYRVTVRMEDGSYRTISHPVAPGYGTGEKVRIIDGSVVPRG